MAVKTLRIKKLSAFEDVTFNLSPGINVLIGANSCGKTHALKWLYASLKVFDRPLGAGEDVAALLKQKIAGVFAPDDKRLLRLVKRSNIGKSAEINVQGDEGHVAYAITPADRFILKDSAWTASAPMTYVPSREALALYEGFVAAYERREMSLDETFRDLCVALGSFVARGKSGDLSVELANAIQEVIGGRVELAAGRFYVDFEMQGGPRLEAQLVAEGLRKIASIARLVQTATIARGGLLIWDEPEASLNPRLVSSVVEILGRLAKEGVQVVLATHDYLLARRLSMLAEAKSPTPMRFFLLSRADAGSPVTLAEGSTLAELPRTPMEDEFLRLYDDERAAFMEP